MRRLLEHVRLTKGPVPLLTKVLRRADEELSALGLTLMSIDHAEFMQINDRYRDNGWYALHDHYYHDRFIGLAIVAEDGEVMGCHGSRPLDLAGKSVGEALDDLSFIYPAGVPVSALDIFEGIPHAAYGITGHVSYMGGFWLNPSSVTRAGLGGSMLLSYLTRSMYASILGHENPDYGLCLVVDNIIRGRERCKSVLDRYGFKFVAPGPVWVNHYPEEPIEKDLPMNVTWIDRAGLINVLAETPWVSAKPKAEPEVATPAVAAAAAASPAPVTLDIKVDAEERVAASKAA